MDLMRMLLTVGLANLLIAVILEILLRFLKVFVIGVGN